MAENDFATELVVQRAKHKMTQKELADEVNVSIRSVAKWESGESLPRKTVRINMAILFKLPPNHFLDDGEFGKIQDDAEAEEKKRLFKKLSTVVAQSELSAETQKNFTQTLQSTLFGEKMNK